MKEYTVRVVITRAYIVKMTARNKTAALADARGQTFPDLSPHWVTDINEDTEVIEESEVNP